MTDHLPALALPRVGKGGHLHRTAGLQRGADIGPAGAMPQAAAAQGNLIHRACRIAVAQG